MIWRRFGVMRLESRFGKLQASNLKLQGNIKRQNPKAKAAVLELEAWSLRLEAFLLHLRRNLGGGLHHVVHKPFEILQAGGRDDDGVAAAADVFGDSQEAPARIFLQGKNERLALDLDLVG